MVEISQFGSRLAIANYYMQKDTNQDGKLDLSEAPEAAAFDQTVDQGDHQVEPWEIMYAHNVANGAASPFTPTMIQATQAANQNGHLFAQGFSVTLPSEMPIDGISFPQGTAVSYDEDGHPTGATLPGRPRQGIDIMGIKFKAGSDISLGYLSSRAMIIHGKLAAGNPPFPIHGEAVRFKEDTEFGCLINPETNQVQVISGTLLGNSNVNIQRKDLPAGTETAFWSDGTLITASLPQSMTAQIEVMVEGASRKITVQGGLSFHLNGEFEGGTLAADTPSDFQPVHLYAGTQIEISDGHLKWAKLSGPTLVDGVWWPAGTELYFGENGRVSRSIIGADMPIRVGDRTITFNKGTEVFFNQDGQVDHVRVSADADQTIQVENQPVKFMRNTEIRFYPDGRVASGTLAEIPTPVAQAPAAPTPPAGQAAQTPAPAPITQPPAGIPINVNGTIVMFKPGTDINFHPNGSVASGILAQDTDTLITNGISATPTFKNGTELRLNTDGRVTQGTLAQIFNIDNRVCETYTVPGHGGGPFAMPASTHESCRGGITRFYAGEVVDFDENGLFLHPTDFGDWLGSLIQGG
jgi:hypothetical protein